MFRFDPERYGHLGVVDEERDAAFEGVGGVSYSTEESALFTWGSREIPLRYDSQNPLDPRTGLRYTQIWIIEFGASAEVSTRRGVGAYVFRDKSEREQALLLALEGLIASRFRGFSLPWDPRKCAVMLDGREWRISDFPGYPVAVGGDC